MHSDGLTLEVRGDMLEHRSFRIDNIIEDYNKNEYELAERIVELENESFKYCTDRNQLRLIVQERKEKIEMLIDENKKYLKVISELENNISTFPLGGALNVIAISLPLIVCNTVIVVPIVITSSPETVSVLRKYE